MPLFSFQRSLILSQTKIISGAAARQEARWFPLGNMVAVIIPVLVPFWFGLSILLYAFVRHHPNPRVFYYLRRSSMIFYFFVGIVIVIGTFFAHLHEFLFLWAAAITTMVPLSLFDLWQMQIEQWQDVEITVEREHD
jgi:hypothetical protein